MVVGAEESQANCWQKATPKKVSLFSCFEKFRTVQYILIFAVNLTLKLFRVIVADADIGSLKVSINFLILSIYTIYWLNKIVWSGLYEILSFVTKTNKQTNKNKNNKTKQQQKIKQNKTRKTRCFIFKPFLIKSFFLFLFFLNKNYFAVPGPLVSPAVAVRGWCKLTSDLHSHICKGNSNWFSSLQMTPNLHV